MINIKYKLDTHFFDRINNPNKAYILGLLYADGNNSGERISLCLSGDPERELLEKIAKIIFKVPRPLYIKKFKNENYKISYGLMICNLEIVDTLRKIGLVERKSLILEFPEILKKSKYKKDFIRGYFDGDGSVSINRKLGNLMIAMVGTKPFLSSIKEFLDEIKIKSNIYETSSKSGKIFSLSFSERKSIDIFYKYLYSNNPELFLSRKKEKFDEHYSNRIILREKTSKYIGVTLDKRNPKHLKWIAILPKRNSTTNSKIIIGSFNSEIEAYESIIKHANYRIN